MGKKILQISLTDLRMLLSRVDFSSLTFFRRREYWFDVPYGLVDRVTVEGCQVLIFSYPCGRIATYLAKPVCYETSLLAPIFEATEEVVIFPGV